MKILIVDDTRLNLKLLKAFCIQNGHTPITAMNGAEAVAQFSKEQPDLILMDVMMPVMDGFEATSRIKALSGKVWIPIILVTAMEDEAQLIQGISSGADDYLYKPVNFALLEGKIKVMQRIAEMQGGLQEKIGEIALLHEKTQSELKLASHVMDGLQSKGEIPKEIMQHWIYPAADFSGDIISGVMTSGDHLNLLLADATGHGLSAALCMMPVIEIFHAMSSRGFSIGSIAQEINKKMHLFLTKDRFIAATLVSVDWTMRTVEVWNGGIPPAYFLDETGHLLKEIKSSHLPLGILPDTSFDAKIETFQWDAPGALYLYSDGLIEGRDASGEPFGGERLARVLSKTPASSRFESLKQAISDHLPGKPEDDISLLEVRCAPLHKTSVKQSVKSSAVPCGLREWELNIHLEPEDIRNADLLPILLTWLKQMNVSKKDSQKLSLIFTELYNNALEHGLLKLDSKIKSQPTGFEGYLDLRERRLSTLSEGSIDIHLKRVRLKQVGADGGDLIVLIIKDSGAGFDVDAHLREKLSTSSNPFGRGITLVNQLSHKMDYRENGRVVQVNYKLMQVDYNACPVEKQA